MDPLISRTYAMLSELAEVMGVTEPRTIKLGSALGRRLAGSRGLVIIDEAQHLQAAALEMLRSLSDRHQVGLALVGNESVYARLQGGEKKQAHFAQLYSRVGMRVTQARSRPQDVDAILAAWGVEDAEQARTLRAIAAKPGGLRGLTKCLRLAGMLAAGDGGPPSIHHIRAAWARLSTSTAAEAA
jgi:DNA transposition AAA+ family ATPase